MVSGQKGFLLKFAVYVCTAFLLCVEVNSAVQREHKLSRRSSGCIPDTVV